MFISHKNVKEFPTFPSITPTPHLLTVSAMGTFPHLYNALVLINVKWVATVQSAFDGGASLQTWSVKKKKKKVEQNTKNRSSMEKELSKLKCYINTKSVGWARPNKSFVKHHSSSNAVFDLNSHNNQKSHDNYIFWPKLSIHQNLSLIYNLWCAEVQKTKKKKKTHAPFSIMLIGQSPARGSQPAVPLFELKMVN